MSESKVYRLLLSLNPCKSTGIDKILAKTRKYTHAETPLLADKTIVFSEHEVFKVMSHDNCVKNILTNEKSPKNHF